MKTKTKITMVDDEPMFTNLVKCNLEVEGDFDVEVVNDPTNAIEKIRAFKPDVILLDIIMPGLDGGDVLNSLEEDPELSDIPVLVLTAMIDHDQPHGDGVVEFGKHTLLAKPISTDTLIGCIRKTLADRL